MAAVIKRDLGLESDLKVGRDGSFEVTYGGRLLFSKLARGRFPTADDVVKPLSAMRATETSVGALSATTGTTSTP